jgi:hypothetical protein
MNTILDFKTFSINEAKKHDAAEDILKMLAKKPSVKLENDKWPDEKNIYSMAGIKKHFKGTYTPANIDDALNLLKNDKKVKTISVKNLNYKESYPYFFEVGYEDAKEDKARLEAKK